jgi:hypothetical protein
MFVKPLNRNDFYSEIFKETKRINISPIRGEESILSPNKKAMFSSSIQKYIYESDRKNIPEIFKKMIVDACLQSEKNAGGSGEETFKVILDLLPDVIKDLKFHSHNEVIECLKEKEKFWIKYLIKNSIHLDKPVFQKILKTSFKEDNLRDIVGEALRLSGTDCPVFVNRSNKRETFIKQDAGFVFNLSIDERVRNAVTLPWKKSNVNCTIIDGFIESESEIHHLLHYAAESGETCIIFCRGMSENVSRLIGYNLLRKTIDVIPVCVGFDENTLNILNDISMAADVDLISHLNGDLISTCVKKLGKIDKIEITEKNNISITMKNKNKNLKNHLKYLKKKKLRTEEGAVSTLLENRIRSLASNKVVIEIGTDFINEHPLAIERLDCFFRSLSSYFASGAVQIKDKEKSFDNLDKKIFDIMSKQRLYPVFGSMHIIKNSFSFLRNIASVGFCLLEE